LESDLSVLSVGGGAYFREFAESKHTDRSCHKYERGCVALCQCKNAVMNQLKMGYPLTDKTDKTHRHQSFV